MKDRIEERVREMSPDEVRDLVVPLPMTTWQWSTIMAALEMLILTSRMLREYCGEDEADRVLPKSDMDEIEGLLREMDEKILVLAPMAAALSFVEKEMEQREAAEFLRNMPNAGKGDN